MSELGKGLAGGASLSEQVPVTEIGKVRILLTVVESINNAGRTVRDPKLGKAKAVIVDMIGDLLMGV